ncbi:MAG: tetratricopeptide repeat protein, partial [Sedimenticola sp.]|nr:tetratricopeptide repeat protein [Sedimenticola sp.]
RSGDQLRVYVDLIEVESGRQLWAERYQRPFNDLFKLQTEISQQIATTLSLKVSEAEQLRLAHRYTTNVQAYELFLKAQSLLLVREEAANNQARQIYRQAIALDPSFARAYAGLALSAAADYRNQWAANGEIALQRAKTMARTALQINPDIPEVYWVLAYVNAQQRQHDKALRLLSKAISLDHSFADAYALMGGIHTYTGHPDETPNLLRTSNRLNPDAGYLYYLLLGRAYFYTGDWEQSLINLNEALDRNPTNLEARIYLAAVMESMGNHQDAIWEADEIRSLQDDFNIDIWLNTYPMTSADLTQKLRHFLVPLGLSNS